MRQYRAQWRFGFVDQHFCGGDNFGGIVRRDAGRHADRDARGTVGEQVGKGRGQHHGLAVAAVVIVAEIDRVLVDALVWPVTRQVLPTLVGLTCVTWLLSSARVLEHAAVHFPGLREAVLAGRGGPAIALAGGEASSAAAFMGAVHAVVEDGGGAAGLAAEWVLAALARRDRELRGGGGGEEGEGDGDGEDSEGPLATAERAWQEALFDALLRGEDG